MVLPASQKVTVPAPSVGLITAVEGDALPIGGRVLRRRQDGGRGCLVHRLADRAGGLAVVGVAAVASGDGGGGAGGQLRGGAGGLVCALDQGKVLGRAQGGLAFPVPLVKVTLPCPSVGLTVAVKVTAWP